MTKSVTDQIADLTREMAAHGATADNQLSWWLSARDPLDLLAFDRAADAQQAAAAKLTKLEGQPHALRRVQTGEAFKDV